MNRYSISALKSAGEDCRSESDFPFGVSLFVYLGDFLVTVAPQVAHPLRVIVDIIPSCHVHDLVSIPFAKLILELDLELCVPVRHTIGEFLQLVLWTESLGRWILERLVCSKVRCVLIVPQVHVKVDLVSVQCHVLDHVTIVRCIAHEVQVAVSWCVH